MLLMCAFVVYALFTASHTDLLYDELTYVVGGSTAWRNIATGAFAPEFWSFEFHPPFFMYFLGAGFGAYVLAKAVWVHGAISLGQLAVDAVHWIKDDGAQYAFRAPSILAGLIILYLVYRCGERFLGSRAVGLIAALFLVLWPPFVGISSVAYLEIGMAVTQMLAVYFFLGALQEQSRKKFLLSAFWVGAAAASKIFAGVIGVVLVLFMVWLLMLRRDSLAGPFAEARQWLKNPRYLALWLLIPPLTLYLFWPWLWTEPLIFFKNLATQMTFKGHGFYFGTNELGHDYYLSYILLTTPPPILLAIFAGLVFLWREQRAFFWLVLFWLLLDVGVISFSQGRHGGFRHVIPAYSALAITAGYGTVRTLQRVSRPIRGATIAIGLAWLAWETVRVAPYPLNYFNFLAGSTSQAAERFVYADAGLGQRPAIEYIDRHAPAGATVWIWGTKPNAFIYSERADIAKSLEGGPLFTARASVGFAQNEKIYPVKAFSSGDLKFRFPYFEKGDANAIRQEMQKEGVDYIVVQRLFSYPGMTDSPGDYEVLREIQAQNKPVFVHYIDGVPVSWVYKLP